MNANAIKQPKNGIKKNTHTHSLGNWKDEEMKFYIPSWGRKTVADGNPRRQNAELQAVQLTTRKNHVCDSHKCFSGVLRFQKKEGNIRDATETSNNTNGSWKNETEMWDLSGNPPWTTWRNFSFWCNTICTVSIK